MTDKQQELIVREGGPAPADQSGGAMALLSAAQASGADVDTIKALAELYREERADARRNEFHAALRAFQTECPSVLKDKEVKYGNTHYKHATYDNMVRTIRPVLSKHGLSFRHEVQEDGDNMSVTCILGHDNGHTERTTLRTTPDTSGAKNAIQAKGSALKYLERYSLEAACGISTGIDPDDDGNATTGNPKDLAPITPEQADSLRQALGDREAKALKYYGVESLEELPAGKYQHAMSSAKKGAK